MGGEPGRDSSFLVQNNWGLTMAFEALFLKTKGKLTYCQFFFFLNEREGARGLNIRPDPKSGKSLYFWIFGSSHLQNGKAGPPSCGMSVKIT